MGNVCCGSKDEGSKATALIDPTDNNSNDLLREGLLKNDENNINAQQQNYGSDLSPQQIQQQQQYESQQQQHQQTIIVDQKQLQDEQQQQQHGSTTTTTAEAKALREEQVRLELIVQATGRRMVAVRSTRGSTGYYDQGFAAALSQHLEQTTEFPQSLPLQIPSLKSSTSTPASSSPQKPSVSSPSSSSRDGGGGGQSLDGTTSTQKTSSTSTKSDDSLYARLAAPQFDGIQQHLNGGHHGHHDASVKTGDGGVNKNPTTAYFDDIAESFLDTVIPKKKHLFAGTAPFIENLL